MAYFIDFNIATSAQIESAICGRLETIRLSRNLSQAALAEQSQISVRTLRRLEKGEGVSFDTFIRVLIALRLQPNLEAILPDPAVRPIERLGAGGSERKRARGRRVKVQSGAWSWADGGSDDDQ